MIRQWGSNSTTGCLCIILNSCVPGEVRRSSIAVVVEAFMSSPDGSEGAVVVEAFRASPEVSEDIQVTSGEVSLSMCMGINGTTCTYSATKIRNQVFHAQVNLNDTC